MLTSYLKIRRESRCAHACLEGMVKRLSQTFVKNLLGFSAIFNAATPKKRLKNLNVSKSLLKTSPRVSANLNKSAPNFSPVSIVKGCGEKIAALRTSETLVDPSLPPTDFFFKIQQD